MENKPAVRRKFKPPTKVRDDGSKLLPIIMAKLSNDNVSASSNVSATPIREVNNKRKISEVEKDLDTSHENIEAQVLDDSIQADLDDAFESFEAGIDKNVYKKARMDTDVASIKSCLPIPPERKGFKSVDESEVEPCRVEDEGVQSSSKPVETSSLLTYFSVLWGKLTTKKHKTWPNDGTLIVDGKNLTLKNGSTLIASASGVKLPDVIEEGSIIKIGGKEVQIQEKISGMPTNEIVPTSMASIKLNPMIIMNKPFIFPGNPASLPIKPNTMKGKPLFDPSAPGALVMPEPEKDHQLINNKENCEIVPVVVDPHIARHLRPHQREGVTFLYKQMQSVSSGAILADDMGLGKTLQAISVLWTLMRQSPYYGKKEVRRALIVTPSSLVKNWEKEFRCWLGAERARVYAVGSSHPLDKCPPQLPIIIISYDMVLRCETQLDRMKFDLLICDEAHKAKNRNGQAYRVLSTMECRKRILLTGTPMQNDLRELYALANLAIPGILGTEWTFLKYFDKPIEKMQDPNATPLENRIAQLRVIELNKILNVFVLRRTHSVMIKYLPPRVTSIIFCKPTDNQVAIYKNILELSVSVLKPLSVILALKKVCNYPDLVNPEKDLKGEELYQPLIASSRSHPIVHVNISLSGKLKVLVRLLSDFYNVKEKVVVVSHYTQTLDILEDVCKNFNFHFKRLDGSTPSESRQKIVDDFNNDTSLDSFVFLLSSKAGGLGLNLVGASRIILFDIDWNPAHDIQAMARCWRPGQTRMTHIYRLITTGTIEEKIFQRQMKKQDLSGSVMDLLINSPAIITADEYKDIFSFYTGDSCQTHSLLECNCKQDGCNLAQERDPLGEKGEQSTGKKKVQALGELHSWQHIRPPLELNDMDPIATKDDENITFIFRKQFEEDAEEK